MDVDDHTDAGRTTLTRLAWLCSNVQMTAVSITSLDDLDAALKAVPAGSLFRGQVRHYVGPDGRVSWPTSHMLKAVVAFDWWLSQQDPGTLTPDLVELAGPQR